MITLPPRAENLIGGVVEASTGTEVAVLAPSTGRRIGTVGLADAATVERAARAAADAFPAWAATAPSQRSRLLRRLADLLGERADGLAPLISLDNGKSLTDARGEIARAREHLEAAAGAPALLAGEHVTAIVSDIDATLVREPLGVAAIVAPFNFPIMTGLIYWSWALACGNTVVIKPSEQAPYAASALAGLVADAGFPDGVVNVVHGGREAVEALCDSPLIASFSLVGSSPTAIATYARASAAGKRAQAAGGARNPLVAMPDADVTGTAAAVTTSAFGMAGQRCLSSSILVAVGDDDRLVPAVVQAALATTVGTGDADAVPPMISRAAVDAVVAVLETAEARGHAVLVDGRDRAASDGAFLIGPSVVRVPADSDLLTTETFGPVLFVVDVASLDDAIDLVNASPFGNAASIFTADGGAARRFGVRADVGNVGVNVGVAAPVAQIGFGGRRRSFFGTVHSQGATAVAFFTDLKSVSTRWPS